MEHLRADYFVPLRLHPLHPLLPPYGLASATRKVGPMGWDGAGALAQGIGFVLWIGGFAWTVASRRGKGESPEDRRAYGWPKREDKPTTKPSKYGLWLWAFGLTFFGVGVLVRIVS